MSEAKKQLYYFGGNGWDSVRNEIGVFQVKANANKLFTKKSQARKYYEGLNEEKAFWDLTRIPELIECHTFTPPSEDLDLPF